MTISTKMMVWSLLLGTLLFPAKSAFTLDRVNVTLPSKSFQFVMFPIAKERGYMKEEGIDLNIIVMGSTAGMRNARMTMLSGPSPVTESWMKKRKRTISTSFVWSPK